MISRSIRQHLGKRLQRIYGDEASNLLHRFEAMLGRYGVGLEPPTANELWDHRTSVLITYADSLQGKEEPPLKTLHAFARKHLKGVFSTVHLLPFFPWSSDDGFSVIDFRKVHADYGSWDDVEAIGKDFELMFDLVLNHCSRKSAWFRDFVTGIAPARWYFLPMDPRLDLSAVVRPRPWPLLTETATRDGVAHVWSTFSADQMDLNWQNPDVLFEFLDILFLYLSKGCRVFRLDAVAFLWKKIGTSCLHLPETHEVVKLLRDVLEIVAPSALILTETNVPHEENLSYFGNNDEAHMVYNFSLPPLLLHALLEEDGSLLSSWAAGLPELSPEQTFFNFAASHDGIGVRPLQGLLPDAEIDKLCQTVKARGGQVSVKANSDGSKSPYELNITYRDALRDPEEPMELSLARFLTSQAIVLAFRGVPAIYIHSLLGTHNDEAGFAASGQARSLNRHKWDARALESELSNPDSDHARIFRKMSQWLQGRARHPAFHPGGRMDVLHLGNPLFGILRTSRTGAEQILCLSNLSQREQRISWLDCFPGAQVRDTVRDILNRQQVRPKKGQLILGPCRTVWLTIKGAGRARPGKDV
jgi:sucrose phosphorylase